MGAGRPTKALAAAGLVGLVAVVLLTRGGTAAGDEDLAGPPPTTAGFPDLPAGPEPTRSVGVMDVGLDGTAGARLGPAPVEGSPWVEAGITSTDGRCSLLLYQGGRAELDVTGWLVDDRVVSVAMRSLDPSSPPDLLSAWGTTFGDDLAAVDTRAPAVVQEEQLPDALVGSVRSVHRVQDGIELVVSDLGSDGGISYVEVREPDGVDCRAERWWWDGPVLAGEADLLLDDGGYGPVRFGQPVEELDALGLAPFPFGQEGPELLGCQVWVPDEAAEQPAPAGLGRVLSVSGSVTAIRLDAGTTAEGLTVGGPAGTVLAAYPEVAVRSADGDLLPPFPTTLDDGRRLDVELATPSVLPVTVDAPVDGVARVVGSVELSTRACSG